MYLRISRLRFVLVRCCLFFIVLLLILELRRFVPKKILLNTNPIEHSFWQQLHNQDQFLTDEERIVQIEWLERQRKIHSLNWTKIFYEIYRSKTNKLNQRDQKTNYKNRLFETKENFSKNFFQIFEETPVFQRPKFCSSNQVFHPQCPYNNCQWSCEKSPINHENLRRANVFHHVDINIDQMSEKIKTRSPNEIWILWIDEANRQLEHLNQYQFNWTISFRQDSEVSIGTYGLIVRDQSRKNFYSNNKSDLIFSTDFLELFSHHHLILTDFNLENQILTNYRYRAKHALWFVSNCEPQQRLNYYQQLKTSFSIQTYGTCIKINEKLCQKNDPCEIEQSRLALFYLAFESQTCTDYITEKFWRALYYGMIPVVLGPSKQSYLDLGVPESAFIHIEDFKSAKDLGKYLHEIANDYFLYRKYFQWLNEYEIFYQTNDLEPIRMCELCMRLNMQEKTEYRFYTNIHQWHRTGC